MFKKLFFKQDIWAISINHYQKGESLNTRVMEPTITAADVTDCKAIFVADPFLIKNDDIWYVFYEVLPEDTRKGVIAYSRSVDGLKWEYGKIVLRENYHMSYPYIFKANNNIYMVPESGAGDSIRLYKANSFPDEWELVKELKKGAFYDSSLFYHNKQWWMITMGVSPEPNSMYIYYADELDQEWKSHELNPIIKNNAMISRSGGRVYQDELRLIRFTQDCSTNYGRRLTAFQITALTPFEYEEKELGEVISNSNIKGAWNQDGMHHIDIKRENESYLVAVDGYYYKSVNKLSNKIYRLLKKYPS